MTDTSEIQPIAWLIRETKHGKTKVACGEVFMREESARRAAARLTNSWRKCEAFPVASVTDLPEPKLHWRCFHCGDVFHDQRSAKLHFGPDEGATPACLVKGADGGLLEALRRAEADAADAWHAVHSESADGVKAYRSNLSRHHTALRAAEEVGYERGMADMRALLGVGKQLVFPRIVRQKLDDETFDAILGAEIPADAVAINHLMDDGADDDD